MDLGEKRAQQRKTGLPCLTGTCLTRADKPLQPQQIGNLVQARRLEDLRRDNIGIHVGSGATVLEIATLLGLSLPGDTYGRPAVCHSIAELVDRRSLVRTREAPLVSFAVGRDVLEVLRTELLDRLDDLTIATGVAHR